MRVVFCYAGRPHPKALRALDLYAPGAERVDTSGDPTNYWREIAQRWDGADDLVLIEQDNEITAKVLPSFAACDLDWCTYEYDGLFGKLRQSLGCTKFSAALQRRFPPDVIAGPGMVWFLIDPRIGKLFGLHNLSCHVHGSVKHYHDYARDPLQRRNVVQNTDGTFDVSERQPDGSLRVWQNCVPKRTRGNV
jgi:hypothetical protein